MADINTVTLSGRLTRDPEQRETQTGIAMANFTIACNRRKFKDQDEAEADFLRCVAWRNTAEYVMKYLHKGDKIGLTGRIQTRSYQDDTGKTVYITEIVANEVSMMGSAQKQEVQYQEPKTTPKKEPEEKQIQFDYGTRMSNGSVKLSEIQLDPVSDDLPF